ncbi:hypothetical protein PRZ48_013873 [Zasmidium cellare]|uniref:Uncharacterized protein n=1 Tax=Zasmidium cellare TaxID=395010 RepID=A0ABR0E291_ZASCE|nr:hypothetical protein PRZ48_013873 [Zasmidium cellare]
MSAPSARVVTLATRKVFERFSSQGVPPPAGLKIGSIVRATAVEVKKMYPFEDIRVERLVGPAPILNVADQHITSLESDPFEMRKSVALELIGASKRSESIHAFEDGTIKPVDQIIEEQAVRKEREERLTCQENWYPHLKQTAIRKKALSDMLEELKYLKAAETITLEDKEFGKRNAVKRYEKVLKEQEQAREVAKAELYGKR